MRRVVLLILLVLTICGTVKSQERDKPPPTPKAELGGERNREPRDSSHHEATKDSSVAPSGRVIGGLASTTAMATPVLSPTAAEIKKDRDEISTTMLVMDEGVVRSSLPDIEKAFSRRGLTEDDAKRASNYGWWELRAFKLSPDELLTPTVFVQYVTGLGMLVIRSNPAGARIEIDGTAQPRRTEYIAWPSTGEHRVKLVLDGYVTIDETCTITEEEATSFERVLTPIKKSP